ncbi:alpha-amylase family glycosyl hydrolase [Caldibacillus lycopersici]|uniref:Alpha-amylase family glycosyl hydrolase n=1 Tax=Perspicuibacillus lycopersici TaxID=1325689 RepID=A0AAE3IR90_9BACI|nr:alpha-amylase family glycosyl hydrolase [Perspicuibacillus lycopersici]MCU9612019.1 alpha-amylase family glycosyl hydrolase [Perspicuibacillus lycopersici]
MTKNVAWIDNIYALTVCFADDVSIRHNDALPYIYWKSANKRFLARIDKFLNDRTVQVIYEEELPLGEQLFLQWDDLTIPVYPRNIVRTKWFEEHYTAPDEELGALCSIDATTFTIWAPLATTVNIILNNAQYSMKKKTKGIWTLFVNGNWHGASYQYELMINGQVVRVNDPYAKAMTANSLFGVVVNLSKTYQMRVNKPVIKHLQDSIIYELHIRDATKHENSGVTNKGTFLGLTEKDTLTTNGYTTALSYIKELGVTHVELLPINDFARVDELQPDCQYNWGYDPLYFQVPEGSYSTFPNAPIVRINECKQMIDSLHQEHISVIIDVVFNHVYIQKSIDETDFEKIVPGYYFRYHSDGQLSNGTGVGNDIASERIMVQKFILDTIDYWLR